MGNTDPFGWGACQEKDLVLGKKAEQSLKLQPGFRKALVVAKKTTSVTGPGEAAQRASQLVAMLGRVWRRAGPAHGQVKGSNSGRRLRTVTRGQDCLFYKVSVTKLLDA